MGASVVMTGLVQSVRAGARVLIRLSSATDSTLWQGDFVYPGLGLVAIENEIVAAVARQVRVESPRPRSGVNEPASDALGRGDYFLASHDPVGPDSARIAYQRALRAEPKSALLMTRLARAYLAGMSRTGRTASPHTSPATIRAVSLIERALAADSSLADAWTAKALLSRVRDPEQYSGAVAAHERAVRLAPRNADAHHEYAVTLMQLGRDDAARSHVRSALLAEQDHASSLRLLAELEYLARRYGPSCALVNASIGADSYDPLAYALRARVRARLGEFRDAFSDAETATRLGASHWGEALEFYVTAVGQDPDAVKTEGRRIALDRLRKGTTLGVREAAFLGMAYATAGDSNRAFDALSRSGSKTAEMRTALRDPGFDRVRSDPRFQRVGTASQPRTVHGQ